MRRGPGSRRAKAASACRSLAVALFTLALCGKGRCTEPDTGEPAPPQAWNLHAQATAVAQYHPAFRSDHQGRNSLDPGRSGRETVDATLFAGIALWPGAGLYLNPEIDQGFGLSNTLGVAGFPSGEAYKVGSANPYVRLPRWFVRQTFPIGAAAPMQPQVSGANQLGGPRAADRVDLTIGKFSVVDVFDTNRYAHDPRADFLNWSVIDAGAFDYAADAWGYTYGVALELTRATRTARLGFFALSRVPNSPELDRGFGQFALIGEVEQRYLAGGRAGAFKVLGFVNRGRMGGYADAVTLSRAAGAGGSVPDTSQVRRRASRPGLALNLEQELAQDAGLFARASINDGSKEAYEFTEVNRSVCVGLSVGGGRWGRTADIAGLAGVVNGLSGAAREYFGAGGQGILIGDGALARYGLEKIVEAYYSLQLAANVALSADFQYVDNPAYNRDRGPVPVFALRLHWDQ
jgi:high affinity Mn2+ porin